MIQLVPPKLLAILPVLLTQYTLGKKAAFPMGMVLGLNAWEVGLIVVLSDFVLMALMNRLLDISFEKLKWGQYLRARTSRVQERIGKRKWATRLMKFGWLGPMIITSTPFAGGVWTGTALARVMNLSNRETILSVGMGVIVGCLIFVLAALGILSIVELSEAGV